MKKLLPVFFALALLFATSCKKNDSTPSNSNTWSFSATTYAVSTCNGAVGTLTAASLTGGATSTLAVSFAGGAFPATGGNFTVSPTPTLNTQVGISLYTGGVNYQATGSGGSNQSVAVTISSAGLISVSGTGIELRNLAAPSDSSALTLNITQQ